MGQRIVGGTAATWVGRLSRRALLRGAAALAGLSLVGRQHQRGARAQDAPHVLAGKWIEDEQQPGEMRSAAAVDPGAPKVFQADFAFYAIAPHWSGEAEFDPVIEIAVSDNGEDWTEPVRVTEAATDAGRPDREARHFGALVFTKRANYVRYRVLDEEGDEAAVPELAFTYLDASDGPSVDEMAVSAQEASLAAPPIISRADWGADESYRFGRDGDEIWPPEYQKVEHVIIHHTDTPNFEDPLLALRSIYYYHAFERGWGDIGYNYLVDYVGNIYEGRYGGDGVVGGHAYQYAHGSSGIGTIGAFQSVHETPEALNSLVWITAWTGRELDPYGSADFHEQPDLPTICSHRDVLATACPGDMLYEDLDTIRDRVSAVLYEGTDPAPDSEFAAGDNLRVVVDQANLRDRPGIDFDVVTTMPEGTRLSVVDGPVTNDGYVWYEVTGDIGDGWCASILVERDEGDPPSGNDFAVGDVAIVDTDALNLRAEATLDSDVVARLLDGTELTITENPVSADGYTWYGVTSAQGDGWCAGEFLAHGSNPGDDGGFQAGDTVEVVDGSLNLRSEPSTTSDVLAVLPDRSQLTVLGGPETGGDYTWYNVESATYGTGWCAADFLSGI